MAFLTVIALILHIRDPMQSIRQIPSISVSTMYLKIEEIIFGLVHRSNGYAVSQIFTRILSVT